LPGASENDGLSYCRLSTICPPQKRQFVDLFFNSLIIIVFQRWHVFIGYISAAAGARYQVTRWGRFPESIKHFIVTAGIFCSKDKDIFSGLSLRGFQMFVCNL
jgi:hypothetical protein